MATFQSSLVAAGIPAKETNQHVVAVHAEYTLATADNTTANVIEMVKVPKGAQILEVILATEDLDSGTALVLDVGDEDDADRFIDGATIGQTGGVVRLGSGVAAAAVDDSVGFTYTEANTIDVTVAVQSTTAVAGVIALTVLYHCDSH